MKIHIHCPGSMTDGLDSPSRGEGRWSQNLARLLAREGHQVYATGGGNPSWGSTEPEDNVVLLPETSGDLNKYGPFDLSMDSAWWEDKVPMVKAKRYLVMKWSLEDYLRNKPLPEDQFICYPLAIRSSSFFEERCANKNKTFFLPLPLGPRMYAPNFDKRGLLWTCKDIDRVESMREMALTVADEVLYPLLDKEPDLYVVWLMLSLLQRYGFDAKVRPGKDVGVKDLVPYCKIRELLSECKLVVSINIPGSVLDAAVLGVPTLEWEEGGFFNSVGKKHGVLIERGAGASRVAEVVDKYLYDEVFYAAYVRDIQQELCSNIDSVSMQYFRAIEESIF